MDWFWSRDGGPTWIGTLLMDEVVGLIEEAAGLS